VLLVHNGANVDRYGDAAFLDAVASGAIGPDTLVSVDGGRAWDGAATVAASVAVTSTGARAALRHPYSRGALFFFAVAPVVALLIHVVR
jgi:hypothetical protein